MISSQKVVQHASQNSNVFSSRQVILADNFHVFYERQCGRMKIGYHLWSQFQSVLASLNSVSQRHTLLLL
ncbi:hypothetical protein EYC84_008382 [Monilinia fructicola]|uniref:Uncharacterized protein n=1 Tax=Monilinia fructicola TaxID=38448 RepID=A0A5M9JIY3_MONFR|nr:hypothetical protein EYC84_008382 [Monilinia fructicola]